jgi:hypothetical protein
MYNQVRHAMSYPSTLAPGSPAPPYPIQNSEFGILKSGIRGAPSMEHGAVEVIYSISHTFPLDD